MKMVVCDRITEGPAGGGLLNTEAQFANVVAYEPL